VAHQDELQNEQAWQPPHRRPGHFKTSRHSPPPKSTKTFDKILIPDPPQGSTLHEGDIVRTTGWLYLIAWENKSGGDSDYHMQLATSKTDGNNCVVVEVPDPDVSWRTDVRPESLPSSAPDAGSQAPARSGLGKFREKMNSPVHVTVTGQLFYDTSHKPS